MRLTIVEHGSTAHARAWVRGQMSIGPGDARFYREQVSDEERRARERTGVTLLLKAVQELLDGAGNDDDEQIERAVEDINRFIKVWNAMEGDA